MKENNNDFLPVISKELNKNRIKQNPLYFVLSKSENLSTSSDVEILHDEKFNKSVFYIKFQGKTAHHIYSKYPIIQRHLTIHKYFKEENINLKNGLSPAHYTEIYSGSIDNRQIVIHIYFDRQGFYKYIQIKQFEGKRQEKNFVELDVNSYIENYLRENSNEASHFLKNLLHKKDSLYQTNLESAKHIENELEAISLHFKNDSIKKYIEKGYVYISWLKEVNNYSDSVCDPHIKIIEDQIKFLSEQYNSLSQYPSLEETTNSSSQETLVVNQEGNPKKKSAFNTRLVNAIYEDILSSYKILTKMHPGCKTPEDISDLIKEHELMKSIQLKILTTSSFITSEQKNKLQKLLKTLDLKGNITRLRDVFKQQLLAGDLENVKLLFSSISHLLDLNFYISEIYSRLLGFIPESDQDEEKLKSVFDFLYKKSESFKALFHSQLVIMGQTDETDTIKRSTLIFALLNKNFFVFKLLLEYGASPNEIGLIVGNIQIPAIYLIAAFGTTEFIQEAIKYGAHYSHESCAFFIDTRTMKKLFHYLPINEINEIKKFNKKLTRNPEDLKCKNLIEWLYKIRAFDRIGYFIPQFKFTDLLYTFSMSINNNEMVQRHAVPTSFHGYAICRDHKEFERISNTLASEKGYLTIILFSKNETIMDVIETLTRELHCKLNFLEDNEPEELTNLCTHLSDTTKTLSKQQARSLNDIMNAWQFHAYIILLLTVRNPTFMTYQAIIQAYCFQARFLESMFLKRALVLYGIAKEIADSCCHADQLRTTPIYNFICKALEKYPEHHSERSEKKVLEKSQSINLS
jgi:hypothetical protein